VGNDVGMRGALPRAGVAYSKRAASRGDLAEQCTRARRSGRTTVVASRPRRTILTSGQRTTMVAGPGMRCLVNQVAAKLGIQRGELRILRDGIRAQPLIGGPVGER
jgi:hypothetical protein